MLLACDKPSQASMDFRKQVPTGVTGGTWIAKYGNEQFTDAELAERFREMNPYARARFQTAEQRQEYLEGLVRFELLSQEAVRQNLQNHPEVIEAAKRVMVQRLLKQELEDKIPSAPVEQVKKYYELHRDDYVKPAMTRLSHIFFPLEKRAEAQATLETVKTLAPLDYAGFGKLARAKSADVGSKELEGDLRFVSDEELGKTWGEPVLAAVKQLEKVGDVAPVVVESTRGLHIVKLTGRQLALNLGLEQARPSIEQVLANESKQERFKSLLDGLRKSASVQLNSDAIQKMVVDTKAPTLENRGPPPGFIPAPLSEK
jgi:peptidyl-prolyl cis-trans isomerase C